MAEEKAKLEEEVVVPGLPAGIPVPRIPSEIGQGWHPLIIELDKKISEIDPDYELDQVKEKFGQLRYFITPNPNDWRSFKEIEEIIEEYEAKSAQICQICGETNCQEHKNA